MRTGSVYALTTPKGTPFYVGATLQSVRARVGDHLRVARSGDRRGSQVHDLLAEQGRTGWWVLEVEAPVHSLGARERYWRGRFAEQELEMLNYYSGGNGICSQSVRAKEKISAYAQARPRGPKGYFLPVPPAMAGGAPTPAELFMGPEELV